MQTDKLLYIQDSKQRKLYYHFTPAAITSNFVPLIVILDDESKAKSNNIEYKMWNVLTPIENFGRKNEGSCWLGDEGDFFVKDLLQELIAQVAEENECEDYIFMYGGNSAGGYGAMLHGILCKATAIYANAPFIKQKDRKTTNKNSNETDLRTFLNRIDAFPIFYLCEDKDDVQNINEIKEFADECKQYDIKCHTDFCPSAGDNESNNLKKVLDMFERMTPKESGR